MIWKRLSERRVFFRLVRCFVFPPILLTHFKTDFAFAVSAGFDPSREAVKGIGAGTGCGAEPNGMIGLCKVPVEHRVVQCATDSPLRIIRVNEQRPHIVVFQIGDGESHHLIVYGAYPSFSALGEVMRYEIVFDDARVGKCIFGNRQPDMHDFGNVGRSGFSVSAGVFHV